VTRAAAESLQGGGELLKRDNRAGAADAGAAVIVAAVGAGAPFVPATFTFAVDDDMVCMTIGPCNKLRAHGMISTP